MLSPLIPRKCILNFFFVLEILYLFSLVLHILLIGLSKGDLIPEISKLAKENTNFSDTDKLGGAYTLYGTTWTVGAMSALPPNVASEPNKR